MKLEAVGVPRAAWTRAPLSQEGYIPPKVGHPTSAAARPLVKQEAPAPVPSASPPQAPPPTTATARGGYDLRAIEIVIDEIRSDAGDLPGPDKLKARKDVANMLFKIVEIRQRETDARAKWLASNDFAKEVRQLALIHPLLAKEWRTRARAVGVELPEPPTPDAVSSRPAPTSAEDLRGIIDGLKKAAELRAINEPELAAAETLALELDVHTTAIARLCLQHEQLGAELFSLLTAEDARALQREFDLRRALDTKDLDTVLRLIGREDLCS